MPIFEMQTSDGKMYEVDAPDMAAAVRALGGQSTPNPSAGMSAELSAMLPDAKAAFSASTGMTAVVPVFAPEMDRLIINYYMNSMSDLGKELDDNAMSSAFQNVVSKAASIGNLVTSRVLAAV